MRLKLDKNMEPRTHAECQVMIWMSRELKKEMSDYCKAKDMSIASFVRKLVRDHLNKSDLLTGDNPERK